MENKLDKIAEEYAEVFKKMNWRWETPTFKGVPDKDKIKKSIIDKIRELKKHSRGHGDSILSGRIKASKRLLNDEDGKYWEYTISLDSKIFVEDELDKILESTS